MRVLAWVALAALITGSSHPAQASAPATSVPLKIEALGKGAVPLDGPWQFHLGDDPTWAANAVDDATGHDGWEQITAEQPWGLQSHANYTGFAWYRRHISITTAPGASPDIALMIPAIDDIYELYWNGVPVGRLGSFPPHVDYFSFVPAQTYGLGPVHSGVLAVRVAKMPLATNDDGTAGGFEALPVIGSPEAIAAAKDARDYKWLRGQQFRFGLTSLYGLTAVFSFFVWLRNRRQRLLFWMAVYTFMPVLELFLNGLRLPISNLWLTFLIQTSIQIREISQWFVLLWLLQLHDFAKLTRFIRWVAIISVVAGTVDGALFFLYPSPLSDMAFQLSDAFLTFFMLPGEAIPAYLVVYAIVRKHKLDPARWLVAIVATVNAIFYSVSNIAAQGVRFTHWTLPAKMNAPMFTLFGSVIQIQTVLRTVLFLSIVYAVVRYSLESRRRQIALEQEFQNARELQQILIPETLPSSPGFTLTSAYKPALEVGGDFFQIIPLEGSLQGSTLIVLGDVSGKGLPRCHDRFSDRGSRAHLCDLCPAACPHSGRDQPAPSWPNAGRIRHLHRSHPQS